MPYIDKEKRDNIAPSLKKLLLMATIQGEGQDGDKTSMDGIVNYLLTKIVSNFYAYEGYATRARGIAAFECAKLEFWDRVVRPYENKKMEENGDVYP